MDWNNFGEKSIRFIMRPIEKDAKINLLDGAVRSSKTVTMIPKWLNYIKKGPPGLLAMTGVSKQTLKTNVLNDLFDTVGRDNYDYNKKTGEMRIYDRKLIAIGIKDEGSEKYLRGPTFAGVYSDETTTMPENSFKQILNRCSVPGARFYGTMNPDSPYHFIYTDFITNENKIASGMVNRIHFELDDNPSLSEEYKKFIRSAYAGLWYKRMVLGLWVQAEGAIYDMFDDKCHVITIKDLPSEFNKILIGCDYGAGNPTVFLKIGVTYLSNSEPVLWIYDEYYHDPRKSVSKTTSQYKSDFIKFVGGEYINGIYPDPSALDFINELKSTSCGQTIKNIHWVDNKVLPGINTVSSFLSKIHLKIVGERCPQILKEFVSYMWDPNAQKRGEDKPLKENDHCMDGLRYPVHTEFPATAYTRIFVNNG